MASLDESEATSVKDISYKYGLDNAGYEATGSNEVSKNLLSDHGEKEEKGGSSNRLHRTMGFRQGFALMVGLMLGSGIFLSPGLVASKSNSIAMMLIIWVSAGLLAMMGSLCYCELAGIFRLTGSNYVNVLKIYGKMPAFLCAWTTCIVIDPASIAAISLTVGLYLAKPFYPTDEDAELTSKIVAAVVIGIAYAVNCISVQFSSRVQSVFAVAQISAVMFVICLGVWQLTEHRFENFRDMLNTTGAENPNSVIPVGFALFGALWSYDGWSQMSNAVEEMENVERNLLLTVMTAFPFVILCYTLVNLALLTLLNRVQMAASNAVGVAFVDIALGKKGSYAMMILVGLSAYGTLNATLFACPRLTLAAAREGHMPSCLSYINKKTLSPIPATTLTSIISLLLLIPSSTSLDILILLFSQAQWVLYAASIFGVVVLRVRQPDTVRSFKVFILVPIIMGLISVTLVVIPFFDRPYFSLGLFGFIFGGIPVYFGFVYYYHLLPNRFIGFMDLISEKLQKNCGMVPCGVKNM